MSIDADTQITIRNRMTRAILDQTGFNERLAAEIASVALESIVAEYHGERLYISPSRTERDAMVRVDFRGNNRREVCEKYNISERTLYRILASRPTGEPNE